MTVHSYRYSTADSVSHRVFVVHGVWTVVLPVPTQPDLAEQLWALVEDPAVDIAEIERTILSRGPDAPIDWAIIRWATDSTVQLRISGSERVDLWTDAGWIRVDRESAQSETDRSAGVVVCGEVTGVAGGAPRGAGIPLDGGIIVAQRLDGRFRVLMPREDSDGVSRHDGMTIMSPDVLGARETEPHPTLATVTGFRVNGGSMHELDATHYFGRNPRQPKIPLPDPARLVALVSPSKLVSATHLEIKIVGGVVVVTDLRSTNGTNVLQPGSAWHRLRGGEPEVVVPGSHLDVGDGNVIEIVTETIPSAETTAPRH
ncbi:MAG: FHA domain-containing protein [Mycetocola sp.]